MSAKRLPNPFSAIRRREIGDTFEEIKDWIMAKNPVVWNEILESCRSYLKRGVSLRVECYGGQHRSYAIVQTLALEFEFAFLFC